MRQGEGNSLPSLTITFTLTPVMPMDKEIQAEGEGVRVKRHQHLFENILNASNYYTRAPPYRSIFYRGILTISTGCSCILSNGCD